MTKKIDLEKMTRSLSSDQLDELIDAMRFLIRENPIMHEAIFQTLTSLEYSPNSKELKETLEKQLLSFMFISPEITHKEIGETILLIKKALSHLPTNCQLYRMLGSAYNSTGNLADAEKAYTKSLELVDPLERPAVLVELATLYLVQGKSEYYEKLLLDYLKDEPIQYGIKMIADELANFYFDREQHDKTIPLLEQLKQTIEESGPTLDEMNEIGRRLSLAYRATGDTRKQTQLEAELRKNAHLDHDYIFFQDKIITYTLDEKIKNDPSSKN